jgi:hypothetical protein
MERYDRMASLRNSCLNYAKEQSPDWVCVIDMDMFGFFGLESYFPQNDCEAGFGLMPKRYVPWHPGNPITSDGVEWVYYDILAVEFSDGTRPHWKGDKDYPDTKKPFTKATKSSVDHPMRVNSAFGGMAFYRFDKIKDLTYEGQDCEHIAFNKAAGGVSITDKFGTIYLPN